jgi:hypothetical protein
MLDVSIVGCEQEGTAAAGSDGMRAEEIYALFHNNNVAAWHLPAPSSLDRNAL